MSLLNKAACNASFESAVKKDKLRHDPRKEVSVVIATLLITRDAWKGYNYYFHAVTLAVGVYPRLPVCAVLVA